MHMKLEAAERFTKEFGDPSRDKVKVIAWDGLGVVVQKDQPASENVAYVWLPYPPEGQTVPEIALEYPGEAGRHSGTYPAAGLKRGEPALRLKVQATKELDAVIEYARAMAAKAVLPEVKSSEGAEKQAGTTAFINPAAMPKAEPVKPRREAIPRSVQREVWQRDGGQCVECLTRAKLCFDHIVPFSKGGGNSVRNLQLLCESCNLSKGNRV